MNSLWDILSVAIGISFIFMILSILNSWIQDYIATALDLRANNLADIMQNLLEPGTKELNGNQRARTQFRSERDAHQGRLLQLLRERGKKIKQELEKKKGWDQQALQVVGATLDRLGDTTERVAQQSAAPLTQMDRKRKAVAGIADLLSENPVRTLYMHPVVYSLSKPDKLPDRLPTKDFTVALLDLLDDAGREASGKTGLSDEINMDCIKEGIAKLEEIELRKQRRKGNRDPQEASRQLGYRLRSLLYTAQIHAKGKGAGLEDFQNAVSEWFEDTLARGSVWYKRRMQRIGILCGFLLAVVLNADTIGLSNALWHNAMLRESVLQAAQQSANQGQQASGEQAQQQLDALTNLGLPIGWSLTGNPADPRALPFTLEGWVGKIVGLLLTGFAISQGSQLWFDLMNRLLNVRSSALQPATEEGAAKEKSKKE